MKSESSKIVAAIVVTALVVGGGMYLWQQKSVLTEKEIISYSTGNLPVSVVKSSNPFGYTAGDLKSMAEECSSKHSAGYFENLVEKFKGTSATTYTFTYQGESQDSNMYKVTLMPNKMGYSTVDQFKNDFDICAAGGDAYPHMVNSNWLLFVNSCGSGYDDGSGRAHGCQVVKDAVESTIRFN